MSQIISVPPAPTPAPQHWKKGDLFGVHYTYTCIGLGGGKGSNEYLEVNGITFLIVFFLPTSGPITHFGKSNIFCRVEHLILRTTIQNQKLTRVVQNQRSEPKPVRNAGTGQKALLAPQPG